MKKPVIIGLIVILIAIFMFFGYQQIIKSTGGSKKDLASTVNYITVEGRESRKSFNNKGVMELREINNQSASIDGKVAEVFFDLGDYVEVGDVLYTYDDSALKDLEDSLRDAQMNLKVAEINLDGSNDSYNNITETVKVTEMDLLPLEGQVYSAQTTLAEYNRQYEAYGKDIANAQSNIQKAKDEYNNQVILFENGIITQNELDTFQKAIDDQENMYEDLLLQRENLGYTIETAKYNLEVANKNLEYSKNPEEKTDLQSQKDQALNGIELSQISVAQAQLQVEKIENQIAEFKKEEVSNYSGVITTIYATKGTPVQEGATVMDISDISKDNLIAVLNVDQKNLSKVEIGQSVEVTSTGIGDETVYGEISKISPTATLNTSTSGTESYTRVEVSFNDDISTLKSGFLVDCDIVTETKENAIFVPIVALLTDDVGEKYIYVATEDNIVEKRFVETGAVDGLDVEVTNLEIGENVITSNLDLLVEGTVIKLGENEAEFEGELE